LTQDNLSIIPVVVPTLDEQLAIADYLDKKCTVIDNVINRKQKLIEKTCRL